MAGNDGTDQDSVKPESEDSTRASSPDAEEVEASERKPRHKRAKLTLRIPDDEIARPSGASPPPARGPLAPVDEPEVDAATRELPAMIAGSPIIQLGIVSGPEAEHLTSTRSSAPPPPLGEGDETPLVPPVGMALPIGSTIDVAFEEDAPPAAPDTEIALPPSPTDEHAAEREPVPGATEEIEVPPAVPPPLRRRSSRPPPGLATAPPAPAASPADAGVGAALASAAAGAQEGVGGVPHHASEPPRPMARAIVDAGEAGHVVASGDRDSGVPIETGDVLAVEPAPAVMPSPRAPLVIIPQHANTPSPLAPQAMSDTTAQRRRGRPWWEDLFNDDFIRTMAKITDEQIAREVDFIEDSLGVVKGGALLDLACGTGRHAIELSRRGYQVVGMDLSLAMLARAGDEAQDRGQKLNFVQGDMREMTFDETFDGVYCWSTSFGFFEEEKNAQVVARVHRALRTGGQFLLDVANRDFVAQQSPSLVWFEGDGCVCMDEMQIDFITSRMKVKRTMMLDDGRTREIDYSIRAYSLHELGKMLHDLGFRVAEVSGAIATPGVFFGTTSQRTFILSEKR